MNRLIKRALIATTFAGAVVVPATTASAAPVITGGLLNVTITDVLSGNQVTAQVPVSVAANICGVPVSVLATGLTSGPVSCNNTADLITVSRQRR
jgi:hypothetical protein